MTYSNRGPNLSWGGGVLTQSIEKAVSISLFVQAVKRDVFMFIPLLVEEHLTVVKKAVYLPWLFYLPLGMYFC